MYSKEQAYAGTASLKFPAMDVIAALRVAALQADRDGMPRCAARHRAQAEALNSAIDSLGSHNVTIGF